MLLGGCGGSDDGTWPFDVTLSRAYDTPARYADAWCVLEPDGTECGLRRPSHEHQKEQPLTRSLSGVELPAEVEFVDVEGRNRLNGWGGERLEVELP